MWSFPRCLTSRFGIIKLFIVHPRNKISSPTSLNRELGQLNIPTNFDQSIGNGVFSPEKPWKHLPYMRWKARKSKRSSHFKVSMFKMNIILSWKVFNLRWKGPLGNLSTICTGTQTDVLFQLRWWRTMTMIARVCSDVKEFMKDKRPKKVRTGGKPGLPDSARTLQTSCSSLQDLDALTKDIPSTLFDEFFPSRQLRKELLNQRVLAC